VACLLRAGTVQGAQGAPIEPLAVSSYSVFVEQIKLMWVEHLSNGKERNDWCDSFHEWQAKPHDSDVNKDLTFKAKDKDQTLKAKDQDKDQTPKDKDKDNDQTFKAKDQDQGL